MVLLLAAFLCLPGAAAEGDGGEPPPAALAHAERRADSEPARVAAMARRLLADSRTDTSTRAWALNVLSYASLRLNDRQAAMAYARQARETAEKNRLPAQAARALLNLALANQALSEPRQGLDLARLGYAAFVRLGDERGAAEARLAVGAIRVDLGLYEAALSDLRQGLAVARRLGDERLLALGLNSMAGVYYYMGIFDQALDNYIRSLTLQEKLGDRDRQATCLSNIALIYNAMGDFDRALDFFRRCRNIRAELKNQAGLGRVYSNIAYTLWRKGDWAGMLANARESLAVYGSIGEQGLTRYPLVNAGVALLEMGELSRALPYLQRGLALSRRVGDPRNEAIALKFISRCQRQSGLIAAALASARQALLIVQQTKVRDEERQVTDELARISAAAGDYRAAYDYQRRAREISEQLNNRHMQDRLAGLRMVYETDRQEKEIELLRQSRALQEMEINRQRMRRNGVMGGALLLLGIAGLLVNRYRLKAQIGRRLEQSNRRLQEISLSDPLTGMKNRRFLAQMIANDVSQSLRHHTYRNRGQTEPPPREIDLGFVLLDLDHFKAVNDSCGQEAGDEVLVQLREVLEQTCRKSDFLVRWGGEELLVVARFTVRDELPAMAERLRRAVAEKRFLLPSGREIHCTVSIGFASFPFLAQRPEAVSWELVVLAADQALALAKADGRNTWFGLQATEQTQPEALGERIRRDLPAMIEQGDIAVLHR